jgi:hypothetical protein
VPGVTSSALFLMWVRNLPMPIKFDVGERPCFTNSANIGRDDGTILTDDAIEYPSPEAAVDCARQMSGLPYYIGAVAFTRHGYPDCPLVRRCRDCEALRRILTSD